jgi:hypothetical protein
VCESKQNVQKGVTVRDETVVLSSLPVVAFGVKRAKELLWFGLRAAVVYGCLKQLQTAVQTESGSDLRSGRRKNTAIRWLTFVRELSGCVFFQAKRCSFRLDLAHIAARRTRRCRAREIFGCSVVIRLVEIRSPVR